MNAMAPPVIATLQSNRSATTHSTHPFFRLLPGPYLPLPREAFRSQSAICRGCNELESANLGKPCRPGGTIAPAGMPPYTVGVWNPGTRAMEARYE